MSKLKAQQRKARKRIRRKQEMDDWMKDAGFKRDNRKRK